MLKKGQRTREYTMGTKIDITCMLFRVFSVPDGSAWEPSLGVIGELCDKNAKGTLFACTKELKL